MHIVSPAPVTGAGHMRDGTPCQDRIVSDSGTVLGHSFTIIGVADGAGSKSYSHYGAETVLKVAVQELSDLRSLSQLVKNIHLPRLFCKLFRIKTLEDMWPDFANRLLSQMQESLEQQAGILGVHVDQLSTTCILALVVDDLLFAMRVGDGALAVRSKTGEISSAFPQKLNSYINETSFVTTRNVAPEIFIKHNIDGLLMSTDGVEPFFLINQMEHLAPRM